MQISTYKLYSPTRSGLIRISSTFPPTWSVLKPAKQLLIKSIRVINTRQQIDFLERCRKSSIFPSSLASQKFPLGKFTVNYGSFQLKSADTLDYNRPLQQLSQTNFGAWQKLFDTISRRVTQNQRQQLRDMISLKYMELRRFVAQSAECRINVMNFISQNLKKNLNKIIDEECSREKSIVMGKHNNKYKKLLSMQHPGSNHKVAKLSPQFNNNGDSGIVVRAVGTFSSESFPLLEKGCGYKLTTDKKKMTEQLKVGVQRTACALRFANPAESEKRDHTDTAQQLQPANVLDQGDMDTDIDSRKTSTLVKSIKSKFDNPRIFPPKTATSEIEDKIKKMKIVSAKWEKQLADTNIVRNYNTKMKKSVQDLIHQPNITVEPTDKTSKIAIVDSRHVEQKIFDHLEGGSYERLTSDPSESFEKELDKILLKFASDKDCHADMGFIKSLRTRNSTAPGLRSLQKDHKPDFPDCKIRPVQPVGQCAVYKIDILVSKILSQILPYLKFRVDNRQGFIKKVRNNVDAKSVKFMASFDVENMFPTMPISDFAINVIKMYLEKYCEHIDMLGFTIENIAVLTKFILTHTYVQYKGSYYRQLDGVGTGSHSSPCYSEIIIDYVYMTAILMTNTEPAGLSLYMDDGWFAWTQDMEAFERFHTALNSVFPGKMVFTYEVEDKDQSLTFLDLVLRRNGNSIEYEFYQKDTHSGKYLDYLSHCPEATKLNIITTETRRVMENCSQKEFVWKHLEHLKTNLMNSNYPEKTVVTRMTREIDNQLYNWDHRLNAMDGRDTASTTTTSQSNTATTKNSDYEYVLKIPYVNEAYTRMVKKDLKDLGINARVVPVAGPSLQSMIMQRQEPTCDCQLCKELEGKNASCCEKHVIYEATCKLCRQTYRGVSNRFLVKRMEEHEASVRLANTRTALGTHFREHYINGDPVPITAIKPSLDNLLSSYTIKKIDKGKDSIEAYIKEGLRIKETKPMLNEKLENGWTR